MDCCSTKGKKEEKARKTARASQAKRFALPALWGAIGTLGLLAFYAILLSLLNSPSHAWQEFLRLWYWVLLLSVGFGIQIGLYTYIRQEAKRKETASVAASGGISAGAMAACCAHHLSEVLPLLGLTAASAFLVKYQTAFIMAGVVSNLIGIAIMLHHIKKHDLGRETMESRSRAKRASAQRISRQEPDGLSEKAIIGIFLIIMAAGLLFAGFLLYQTKDVEASPVSRAAPGTNVITGTTDQGDVAIDLTPQGIVDGQLIFEMGINTHSVDLSSYDLTEIAVLEYNGKRVKASAAPQLGGHHVNGALVFPVDGTPTSFTVRIDGIPQQQERVFAW